MGGKSTPSPVGVVLRGVADTNVLVSAAISAAGICGQLLAAAEDSRWQLVVSPELLAELEDVLRREEFESRFSEEDVANYLRRLARIAEVVSDAPEPWTAATRDPKDDYLVALARAAGVDALISGDGDLTSLTDLVPPVIRPADFLAMVRAER